MGNTPDELNRLTDTNMTLEVLETICESKFMKERLHQ